MSAFTNEGHPRELNNLIAVVEEIKSVEWDGDSLVVKVFTYTEPEGWSVPVALSIDEALWSQIMNMARERG